MGEENSGVAWLRVRYIGASRATSNQSCDADLSGVIQPNFLEPRFEPMDGTSPSWVATIRPRELVHAKPLRGRIAHAYVVQDPGSIAFTC